jgi:hypothetical protein
MENLYVSYETIKQVLLTIPSYYILQGDGSYDLFSIGEYELISCHIDLYDDIEKMKHLNFTKIVDRAEEYHKFKDLAWEEFAWIDEDAPENFTMPWTGEEE